MHSFEVSDSSPDQFVAVVRAALSSRGLDQNVSVRFVDGQIVARISWLGTSELRYRVRDSGSGFRADLERQRVSALHSAFQGRFEERFEEVLAGLGARMV